MVTDGLEGFHPDQDDSGWNRRGKSRHHCERPRMPGLSCATIPGALVELVQPFLRNA